MAENDIYCLDRAIIVQNFSFLYIEQYVLS